MFKNFFTDEPGNGAETVEIVIGIVCSVGLGAALLSFQGVLKTAIENTGSNIAGLFSSLGGTATNPGAGA